MPDLDLNKAAATDYSDSFNAATQESLTPYAFPLVDIDTALDAKETKWQNPNWTKYWGWFIAHPKVRNAILMKAIWSVGKGWEADTLVKTMLEHISGAGKESFKDILFSMEVCRRIGGDAYAEIITHNGKKLSEGGKLVNLKCLNPGNIAEIYGPDGMLLRYEQIQSHPKKGILNKIKNAIGMGKVIEFDPEEIFHLSNNKIGGQIHGISDLEALEKVILADQKSFDDLMKITMFQAKPFILFKLKTDDPVKIAAFSAKIRNMRNLGEDMFIPDDENLLSWEVVQVNPSSVLMEWRADLRNEYYRCIGLPQIIPGAGGQGTESEGRVIYVAFEQIVMHEQKQIEDAIWNQLGMKVNLIHPTLLEDLIGQTMQKNGNTQLNTTPAEMNPAATAQ